MAPKPVTADKWKSMTRDQRYAFVMAGGVPPAEREALTNVNADFTSDGIRMRPGKRETPRPPAVDTKDATHLRQMLDRAGIDPKEAAAVLQRDPSLWTNATSTSQVFENLTGMKFQEFVSLRDQYAGAAMQEHAQYREDVIAEYEAGNMDAAETFFRLEQTGGVNPDDPRLAELVSDFHALEDWGVERVNELRDQAKNQEELEASLARMQSDAQDRAQAREAQEEQDKAIDAVLEKYAKHADDPLVAEAVASLFMGEAPPSPEILERTIQDARVVTRAMEKATEKFEQDKAIRDQLVAGNVYGRDPQTGETLAPEVEIGNYIDHLAAARQEIIPDEKVSVSDAFDAAHKPDEQRREVAEEIQVTGAATIASDASREDRVRADARSHWAEVEAKAAERSQAAPDIDNTRSVG